MPDPVQLWSLPNDVLRVVATIMPLSGLIVMVQSSRTIAGVLQDQLTLSLDEMFVLAAPNNEYLHPNSFMLPIQPPLCEIVALFGEEYIDDDGGVYCHLIEAPTGYDGPPHQLELFRQDNVSYVLHGRRSAVVDDVSFNYSWRLACRFASWLQRRCGQLMSPRPFTVCPARIFPYASRARTNTRAHENIY
jgi:hypothetical protein